MKFVDRLLDYSPGRVGRQLDINTSPFGPHSTTVMPGSSASNRRRSNSSALGMAQGSNVSAACRSASSCGSTLPPLIELHSQFDNSVPSVEMDVGQIHQIVMNLCTNAAHAIGDRSGRIELALESSELTQEQASALASELSAGPHVRLSVSDTGCGMDESTPARIFEPFFSTKAPDKGTGLGLSVVYGIVKGHRAAITAYSRRGEGTTFHIYFPAA